MEVVVERVRGSEKEWLTVPEVAKRIGVGRTNAYELIKSGVIPSFKISERGTRVNVKDVDDYVRRYPRPT